MPTDPLPALLAFAAADDNIRAVLLQGSRANPNGLVDRWSDYDVAFVTRSNEPYLASGWFDGFVRQFGPVAVAQQPDDPALFDDGHDPRAHYAFLTQFADGLRLDLTFVTVDSLDVAGLESATVVLRDLDGVVPVRPPSDAGYRTPAPSAKQFAACCDEFWWTVPRTLLRGQGRRARADARRAGTAGRGDSAAVHADAVLAGRRRRRDAPGAREARAPARGLDP